MIFCILREDIGNLKLEGWTSLYLVCISNKGESGTRLLITFCVIFPIRETKS